MQNRYMPALELHQLRSASPFIVINFNQTLTTIKKHDNKLILYSFYWILKRSNKEFKH